MIPPSQRFRTELMLHGFAGNTIDVYMRAVRKLYNFYKTNPVKLSDEQIRMYLRN